MNFEQLLFYVTHNSEKIIQWLFLAILLLSSFLIARTLFKKKESSSAGVSQGEDIQGALQRILEQTARLEKVPLASMSPANVAEVEKEVQELKANLKTREDEIAQLKAAGSAAPAAAAAAAVDTSELSARIKELETKLSEYEILEDDIADLSLYKEENVRLKAELASKSGGTQPPAEAAAAVEEPIPAPAPSAAGEEIVKEFAQSVGAPEAAPAQDPSPAPEPVAAAEPAPPPPRSAEPEATPVVEPAAAAPAPTEEADDLFAEFSESPEEPALDTDKMMAEMADLVKIEPTQGSSLEEKIDTDKMAAEASDLQKS